MGEYVFGFENLEVYKRAREFRKKIYRLAAKLPSDERFNLAQQMRRAAVSLTNNIAEGHGRLHFQESIQFFRQSRGSLQELLDDVNTCIDEHYDNESDLNALKTEGAELLRFLNGYIAFLRRSKSAISQ
ncbi:MAG: four helix bundle protein [Ignavibacteriales bacterium]|nr:four helix bundle protein [Ignavibacteriales bacterium]